MDLACLMQSMSLDASQSRCSSNFHVFALNIAEYKTDFVYGEFNDKHFVITTQYGRLGSFMKVFVDQSANGPVYQVQLMFGVDSIEQLAAARFIAEKLEITKTLLIFLCLKDYSSNTLSTVVNALMDVRNNGSNSDLLKNNTA